MKVCFYSSSLYNDSSKSIKNDSETNQNNSIQIRNSNINFGNNKKKLGIIGMIILAAAGFLGVGNWLLSLDKGQVKDYQKIILEEGSTEALNAAKQKAAKIKGPLAASRKFFMWAEAARQASIKNSHSKKPHIPHIKNPLLKKGRIR